MNEITRAIWDRDLTVKQWAKKNKFSYPYVLAVISGRRCASRPGTGRKIIKALEKQSLVPEGFQWAKAA